MCLQSLSGGRKLPVTEPSKCRGQLGCWAYCSQQETLESIFLQPHMQMGLQLEARTALCSNSLCFLIHSHFLREKWTDRKQELNVLLIPEHLQAQFKMQYLKSGCVFHTFAIHPTLLLPVDLCASQTLSPWALLSLCCSLPSLSVVTLKNQIRLSPQQWELTKDAYDPQTPGSWNQEARTRNCNCHEQQRNTLTLSLLMLPASLLASSEQTLCIQRAKTQLGEKQCASTCVWVVLFEKGHARSRSSYKRSPEINANPFG